MRFLFFNLISISVLSLNVSYAQSLQNSNTIKCHVKDSKNGETIPFANVFNESERTWVYAKENGNLNIWASSGDTLAVSAIGYYDKVMILSDSILKTELILINLEPRVYEIGEAIVKGVKSYSQFKQDVVNLQLPKTELDSVSENLAIASKKVVQKADYDKMVEDVFARPEGTLFMIGSSFKTKGEKDKKKLKSREIENIANQKFNLETVKKYTTLNDQELIDFILFCNFTDDFILESSEYEIAKAIDQKLQEFKLKDSTSD